MLDGTGQRSHNLFLSPQEIRAGQVAAGDRMVCDEAAVACQVLYEGAQFLQHFLFGKRGELAATGFFQKRRAGEERCSPRYL